MNLFVWIGYTNRNEFLDRIHTVLQLISTNYYRLYNRHPAYYYHPRSGNVRGVYIAIYPDTPYPPIPTKKLRTVQLIQFPGVPRNSAHPPPSANDR